MPPTNSDTPSSAPTPPSHVPCPPREDVPWDGIIIQRNIPAGDGRIPLHRRSVPERLRYIADYLEYDSPTFALAMRECADAAEAEVRVLTQQRDVATELVRTILVEITQSLGLDTTVLDTDTGVHRPMSNSLLYRELGRHIECADWEWPT